MEPDDNPHISSGEIDLLYALAKKAGIYRDALLKQGLSKELADQLTRDWHQAQLQKSSTWAIRYPAGDPAETARAVREELIKLGKRSRLGGFG